MRRVVAAAALAGLLIAGCGGGGSEEAGPAAAVGAPADPAVYDGLIAALGRARIPVTTCPVRDGGAFEVIPPAARALAAGVAQLQYTDGRLYELGPCETPHDDRTLLRMYHFPDQAARDAAVTANDGLGLRATSAWTYQAEFTVELWMRNADDTGPVGAVASAAHLALGAVPGMEHS